ncbi:MAG: DUF3618 domain-containing protein [Proteobacteria bacterium]|nr:DUF3618 domain-containing protein [Pseudomonadota bacterium]
MSDDERSIAEIEADLERDRQALQANIAELKDRLSPGGIAREALGAFDTAKPGAVALGALGSVGGAIRSNPIASLIAGAGLVWLAAKPSGGGRPLRAAAPAKSSALGQTVAAAAAMANVVAAMEPEEIRAVAAEVDRIYRAGAARLREIDESVRKRAGEIAETVSDKSQEVRDIAAEKARVAGDVAAEVRSRLEHGVEGLSQDAAAALIAARVRAYKARRKASRKAVAAHDDVARLVDRHPVAMGGAAAAAGALLAVALGAAKGGGGGKREG